MIDCGDVGVVILAAGGSTRMGRPKQLLPCRGGTLLGHAIETARASACRPVVVVLGSQAREIRSAVDLAGTCVVENALWQEGLGSSIRCGVQALLEQRPAVEAVIVALCDQPLVTAEHLDNLAATWKARSAVSSNVESQRVSTTHHPLIVASEYGGQAGVPALFARELFPELMALRGPGGAKQVLQARSARMLGVPFEPASTDVDTPADYSHLGSEL